MSVSVSYQSRGLVCIAEIITRTTGVMDRLLISDPALAESKNICK